MKASRIAKMEAQLADLEAQLRSQLSSVLPRVSVSGGAIFFNSAHLPEGFRTHWLPSESEPLFQLACECIELRERLSLSSTGSVAAKFLLACAEAIASNPQRRGPRLLAKSLHSEVFGSAGGQELL